MRSDKWQLKCRVQKGMFDNEYLAIIEMVDEKGQEAEAAVFVDKEELNMESLPQGSQAFEGLIRVSPLEITRERASVVLPNSTLSNSPIVSVRRSDLVFMEG